MNHTQPRYILIIDPDYRIVQPAIAHIQKLGHTVQHARHLSQIQPPTPPSATEPFVDIIICAVNEPADLQLLETHLLKLKQRNPQLQTIIATSPQFAHAALTMAATIIDDYVLRPYHLSSLANRLRATLLNQLTNNEAVLQTIFDIQTNIVKNPDSFSVKPQIVTTLVHEFGYHVAVFYLLQQNGMLIPHAAEGIREHSSDPGHITLSSFASNPAFAIPLGQGFIGKAADSGEMIEIFDLNQMPASFFPQLIKQEQLKSAIAVPLRLRNDVSGVLACFTDMPHRFDQTEKHLLESLANLTAVDIYNAQQYTRWQQIEQISHELGSLNQLDESIQAVAVNALTISDAAGVTVCFYDNDTHQFDPQLASSAGAIDQDLINWHRLHPDWHHTLYSLMRSPVRKSLLIPDIQGGQHELQPSLRHQLIDAGIRALIVIKLEGQEDPLAALIAFYSRPHPFAYEDDQHDPRAPLNAFSEQAAVILEHATSSQRYQEERLFIQRFADKVNVIPVRQDIADAIWIETLQELLKLTGGQRAIIWLNDQSRTEQYAYPPEVRANYLDQQIELGNRSPEGWVLHHHRACIIRNEDNSAKWILPPGIRSKLVVPIVTGESIECVGLIVLEAADHNIFDRFDLQLVENLAVHIGVGGTFDQVYGARRYLQDQLRTLVQASQQFSAIRPVREKLARIIQQIRTEADFDLVRLNIYDPYWSEFDMPITAGQLSSNKFVVMASSRIKDWPEDATGDIYIADIKNPHNLISRPFIEREQIKASGVIRLRYREQIIGLLFINRRTSNQITPADINALRPFIDEIIDTIIQSAFLPTLVDNVRDVLQCDLVRLHLFKHTEQRWSRPVSSGHSLTQRDWEPSVKLSGVLLRAKNHLAEHGFVSDAQQDERLNSNFVRRENIRRVGYVHLKMGNELVGILFVNWRKAYKWTEGEKYALQLFANQAAVAIHNRRQLQIVQARQHTYEAFQAAARNISMAGLTNNEQAFDGILTQAMEISGAYFGSMYMVQNEWLVRIAVSDLHIEEPDRDAWIRQFSRLPISGRSLCARAVRANHFQNVTNVRQDADYLDTSRGRTQSELVVVLRDELNKNPIGVISVQHQDVNGFDNTDFQAMVVLADMASLLLKNIEQYQDLVQLKKDISDIETMAWAGLFGSNWWHSACQQSSAIKYNVRVLQRLHKHDDPTQDVLADIYESANEIELIPKRGWLPKDLETPVRPLRLDEAVLTFVAQYCRQYDRLHVSFDLNAPHARANIDRAHFELVLEKLINNAVRAMQEQGHLKIVTMCSDEHISLLIEDKGPGIPPEIQNIYLKERIIRQSDESGSGIGGFMARFVLERCGGEVNIVESNPQNGTTVRITLPRS